MNYLSAEIVALSASSGGFLAFHPPHGGSLALAGGLLYDLHGASLVRFSGDRLVRGQGHDGSGRLGRIAEELPWEEGTSVALSLAVTYLSAKAAFWAGTLGAEGQEEVLSRCVRSRLRMPAEARDFFLRALLGVVACEHFVPGCGAGEFAADVQKLEGVPLVLVQAVGEVYGAVYGTMVGPYLLV